MSKYEQSILDTSSSPRLRRAVLDNPPEPEVPWHIYPVPTHYKTITNDWLYYDPSSPPGLYRAMRYSDGSIRSSNDWGEAAPATIVVKLKDSVECHWLEECK